MCSVVKCCVDQSRVRVRLIYYEEQKLIEWNNITLHEIYLRYTVTALHYITQEIIHLSLVGPTDASKF